MRTQEELTFALDCLSDRDDVRAIVLTGKGKVFCAGIDIKAIGQGEGADKGERRRNQRSARESYHSIRECTKPVVGTINGAAPSGLGSPSLRLATFSSRPRSARWAFQR